MFFFCCSFIVLREFQNPKYVFDRAFWSYAHVNNIYTKETVSEKCFICFFCDNILLFFLDLDKDQKGGND